MNKRDRADYVALRDFDYKMPFGVFTTKFSYKKGDVMSLRTHGRMAVDLLRKGYIKRVEKEVIV